MFLVPVRQVLQGQIGEKFGLLARYEHTLVHLEVESVELAPPDDIGQRLSSESSGDEIPQPDCLRVAKIAFFAVHAGKKVRSGNSNDVTEKDIGFDLPLVYAVIAQSGSCCVQTMTQGMWAVRTARIYLSPSGNCITLTLALSH